MSLPALLILLPVFAGLCLLYAPAEKLRRVIVIIAVAAVAIGTIALAVQEPGEHGIQNPFKFPHVETVGQTFEALIALFVIGVGFRQKSPLIVLLMAGQLGLLAAVLYSGGGEVVSQTQLFIDPLVVVLALINGIVGGGICLYALDYMREYHERDHKEIRDRRPYFFALLFGFVGAMFGLVFANDLLWIHFFWEVTTLCSFLLIGYTQTDEARRNARRALIMNLAGGLAFALAIYWLHTRERIFDLQTLIAHRGMPLMLIPAALLCFAGMTKSAQLPFSSWLLGAMVAPTPVSALLHSSTMVKAGVYMVLRMAPLVSGTSVGMLVAVLGAVTFVVSSFAAITTSDAKRVLAHSTCANLGLIVLCGGLGTPEAIWAGILLIVFHAVAKCLLFLCVGVVEQRLHSRDIEAMSGLVYTMPRVALLLLVGMAGMFLAPFGMLISKYAVLKAVVDALPSLSLFIAFGSSATLFFWAKWMGKLLQTPQGKYVVLGELTVFESLSVHALAAATFCACVFFPLLSKWFVEPYVYSIYPFAGPLGQGNLLIMGLMMGIVLLFPLSFINIARSAKHVSIYLGGANLPAGPAIFEGSAGVAENATMSNYYLRDLLDEAWLSRTGALCCISLLCVMGVVACL